ncbi:hypothetical protein DIURU_002534 [Diutina rugosa]|uniref:Uncharacterized protein n=1 Tax=Diutina rugosa TaxID=5481 RepID=A0A642UQ94_DIURU|nr:uncharacterized protein DIURU_002534 [Diutina rugosa]KAA8903247.1 hypothetical protein DIURU_002534 [Diutina rugosa]
MPLRHSLSETHIPRVKYPTTVEPIVAAGFQDHSRHNYLDASVRFGDACVELLQATGKEDAYLLYLYAQAIHLAVSSSSSSEWEPGEDAHSDALIAEARENLKVAKQLSHKGGFHAADPTLRQKIDELYRRLTPPTSKSAVVYVK